MKHSLFFISSLGIVLLFSLLPAQNNSASERQGEVSERQRQEESEDYFERWLNQDAVYIIMEEERDVFGKLTTPNEKEQFIEQFWYRRDMNLTTKENEFKEEHYRRIAYANENFASGIQGWMSDRGRIYITHGPPSERETRPSGGTYNRTYQEGGGTTVAFPFEKWWYRHIEGMGDVELEFVDPTFSGEYRLAIRPEEKDALLNIPGAAPTLAEEMGLAGRADRPIFRPENSRNPMYGATRYRDNPFRRYETYAFIQRPVQIKYKDLKGIIDVNITYSNLPFKFRPDYFRLNEQQVLVPITLEFENRELTFKKEGQVHVAKIGIYGIVTSLTNRIIQEFEDDVSSAYQPEYLEQGLQMRSMYQKVLPLKTKMRYKIDIVVKDLNSGKVGVIRQAIIPPAYEKESFSVSSLILAQQVSPLREIPKREEMFVLGDVKVLPNLGKVFRQSKPVGVYLQVYNASLDQTTLEPSLQISYQLLHDGETVSEYLDNGGTSIQYASGQRVVLIGSMSTEDLEPGDYRIRVEVRDRISNRVVSSEDSLQIIAHKQLAQR